MKKSVIVAAGLITTSSIGIPAALAASTAARPASVTTLRAASSSVTTGKTDVLSVTLKSGSTALSGTVNLEVKLPGAKSFTPDGTITVVKGKATKTITISKKGTYYFHTKFHGSSKVGPSHSDNVRVTGK